MARYRVKDSVDLAWNRIRRRITREVDLQIADAREEILNDLLGKAWEEYKNAISTGETLELEPSYNQFVRQAIHDIVDVKVDREAA